MPRHLAFKKSLHPVISRVPEKVCPMIFKRKITLRPVIFLIIKSVHPVIYDVQNSIRTAAS